LTSNCSHPKQLPSKDNTQFKVQSSEKQLFGSFPHIKKQ